MATRTQSQLAPAGSLRERLARALDRVLALAGHARRALERLFERRPKNVRAVLPLVIGAGITLAAGISFLHLGQDIRDGDFNEFDDGVLLWVAERRSPVLSAFFVAMTALGSWPVMTVLALGTCTGTWLAGERRLSATLAIAMLGVPLLSHFSKSLYGRERPRVVPHLETVASASFPSGHTLASVVFFVTLALLAGAHARHRRLRVFLVGYSLAIGTLVAASRVYLGVHFPSDVMGGALVGVAWSLAAVTFDRALRGKVA